MMTITQSFYRRLYNKIRRPEIGLANSEIDDVAALRGQRIGARKHGEGIFLANTVKGRDSTEHNCSPPVAPRPFCRRLPYEVQFSRSGRKNQTRQTPPIPRYLLFAAKPAADIAPDLKTNIRVGVITEIDAAVVQRPRRKFVGAPVLRCHLRVRGVRRNLLVLFGFGGVGR